MNLEPKFKEDELQLVNKLFIELDEVYFDVFNRAFPIGTVIKRANESNHHRYEIVGHYSPWFLRDRENISGVIYYRELNKSGEVKGIKYGENSEVFWEYFQRVKK